MNMDATSTMSATTTASIAMSMSMASGEMMSMMMSSAMSMASSAVSSMVMDMSSSSMSMNMASMTTSPSSSMTMSMQMSTSTAQSSASSSMSGMSGMSGMDMGGNSTMSSNSSMSGMDMDMDMGMNYYLTRTFNGYPVLFHGLHANTKAKAFGIFVLLMTAAFVYKFLLFVSWCLEVHWFKKWNKKNKFSTMDAARSSANKKDQYNDGYLSDDTFVVDPLPKLPNVIGDIFRPSLIDVSHDLIRTLLTFTSTMIIYMLMLAAMSFVLTYVFGIITGLALAEVFFNRCKLCMLKRWDIQRELENTKNCPGAGNCQCGRHRRGNNINNVTTTSTNVQNEYYNEKDDEREVEDNCCCEPAKDKSGSAVIDDDEDANCACGGDEAKEEKNIERNISANIRMQEQGGAMDVDLLPSERFQ
ncbi:hypothetical protein Kpol_1050p92 [Vanderwaltozyma polyspora DSM 70294]|uniref:Copper transport protein n=1 Tax=Vanderwaltozyma polyspora (strain ATCC 22028 / DSM 70294 / BCRC 21397 / CBS 2163 / NBRC 10782 / NRRL Y-8283 / UCD 57-17) TaxID=436907 RepID=A7TEY6_VANPO|nr:uncharacterized protein Kpol_1050p92 [Vanderwaltozyma polyspora DSM 70294]EDO19232.1 hypothetical protein Kpol_1050p92 [Vanderwaltozyma polyspora DSM 70294]